MSGWLASKPFASTRIVPRLAGCSRVHAVTDRMSASSMN